MIPPARTPRQRKTDTLRLEQDSDVWVASAGLGSGTPSRVPLPFLWDGATVLIATPAASPGQPRPAGHGQRPAGHRPGP